MLPPLPPWEGMHPLLVHFPIALLTLGPLVLLLALLWPSHRRTLAVAALVCLLLGTGGAMLAVLSGEAAEELVEARAEADAALRETLEQHEELGEAARTTFLIVTVLLALLLVAEARGKLAAGVATAAQVALAAAALGGLVVLVNAAHRGGLLVHAHGVRAPVAAAAAPAGAIPAARRYDRDEDD